MRIHFYMPQYCEHMKIEHDDGVISVAFSPNGKLLATGSGDSTARIIKLATGAVKHLIKYGHRVAFSPNGEWLAIVSYDNLLFDAEGYEIRCDKYVRLIKVATGAVRHVFKEHSFESVAFSPNSALLAMGSLDKNVRIIEVATGAVKYIIPQDDGVKSVAFSPNGQWLATGSSYRNARIIEVATGM